MSRFPFLLVLTLLSLPLSAQPRYRLISLGDAGAILGSGINSSGDIVGRTIAGGNSRSFLYRDGALTVLPDLTPNYRNSTAISLNDQEEVAGVSYAPTAPPFQGYSSHAFYWSSQTGIVNLTPETSGLSIANAINNHGEVVGMLMQGPQSGAMLWRVQRDGTVLTERVTPASDWAANAYDINDHSLVTGSFIDVDANALRPYVFDARTREMTILPAPRLRGEAKAINGVDQVAGSVLDAQNANRVTIWNRRDDNSWHTTDLGILPYPHVHCSPNAINNRQQVVGECLAEGPVPPEAWLWTNGKMTPLENLVSPEIAARWHFYNAYDINDSGVIVGAGLEDGHPGAYILVPEAPPARRRAVRK
jgi:uncharacterized membrane protein